MARKALILPAVIIGPADLTRVKRRLEAFNEQQHQAELRSKAGVTANPMRLGRLYTELAALNGYDLSNDGQRAELLAVIEDTLANAPTVTISFAVDPSADVMFKLVEWFRRSIHPQVLVRIGLQPDIAAGCVLRTPSKLYDFSLRRHFTQQRPLLVRRLQESLRPPATSLRAPVMTPSAAQEAQ